MGFQKTEAALAVVASLCLAICLVTSSPVEEKRNYRNYKVIRTEVLENLHHVQMLSMLDGSIDISFWKYPAINESVDIMASPDTISILDGTLNNLGLEYRTMIEDVEELFENQNDLPFEERQASSTMSWTRYHRYDVILNYAKQQAASSDMVTYQSIGKSTEGRELGLVKISTGGGNKPAIFVDGGMHAREWISPATVTYIMHNLINNNNYKDLVDSYDWYIVPLINADGYEYTHTRDRMWRKTRRPNPGSRCYGTDPNRNWNFQWGGAGTSPDPCSDIYKGPRAFSEPETAAVANAILARRQQIKLYLTFHSYSQIWLLPWGYTDQRPADYQDLFNMAYTGAKALSNTYGTRYKVGNAKSTIGYHAAGGSDDWAKGAAGIKYSYTLELRDTGAYGFALPASQIQATGEETLRGVAALARALHKTVGTQAVG